MSNMITMLEEMGERTPEQNEALYMHGQLVLHKQMVEVGLAGMCRDLKEIRDRKLYLPLGYEDFGAYTEQEHGIKQRQAYKYIQVYETLGVEFLHSNAKIGITNLVAIAALDRDEREELLAEHSPEELGKMKTAEVKALIEKVKKLEEQISFFEEEKAKAAAEPQGVVQQPFSEIEADIREEVEIELKAKFDEERTHLEQRIASLEMAAARSVSDEELKKYRENAEKEAKASVVELTKQLKSDLKAANEARRQKQAELDKILEEKEKAEQAAKDAEEKARHAAELESKIEAAEAEKAAIEKQIKLSADPEFTKFKFMFEQWQTSTMALKAQLDKLDTEKQAKCKGGIDAVLKAVAL